MNYKNTFYLGYIAAKHGLNSSVMIKLDVNNSTDYIGLNAFFIDLNKNLVPVFSKNAKVGKKNELIVDIEDIEDVKQFVGCSVYLPLDKLPKLDGNKFYYHEVIGYKVVDINRGDIGQIETVLDFPHQQIFSIRFGKKEILIPIIDEFIITVDKINKSITIKAPEGLIDIYLEDTKEEE